MKIYFKPSTEMVDPALTRDITGTDIYKSKVGDGQQAKGNGGWVEEEENDDSGFGW